MAFIPFTAYNPYYTFRYPEGKCFVDGQGSLGQIVRENPDLGSLWALARDAFEELQPCGSAREFVELTRSFFDFINSVERGLKEGLAKDGAELPFSLYIDPEANWIDAVPIFVLVKLGWNMTGSIDKFAGQPDLELHEIFRQAFLMACLYEIDAALLGMKAGGQGAIASALNASESYSLAAAISAHGEQLKSGKREMGRQGARARIEKSEKTAAKDAVHLWWLKWQGDKTLYKSKRAFADAMRDKHPELENEEVIKRWTLQWEREQNE
jgi:hypothetical protein